MYAALTLLDVAAATKAKVAAMSGYFAAALPDGCVLDGEILVWAEGEPLPLPFARR